VAAPGWHALLRAYQLLLATVCSASIMLTIFYWCVSCGSSVVGFVCVCVCVCVCVHEGCLNWAGVAAEAAAVALVPTLHA
jgi:hypothetical protein